MHRIIYIGESENIRLRIMTHEKNIEWKKYVRPGNYLCYNCTETLTDRVRIEAAYIYFHKPICNIEYKNTFPFDTTTISSEGRTGLIEKYFTVYPQYSYV